MAPTRDGSVPEVSVEWYLNTEQEFQLVDCREDNEWAVAHIEGAVHIALSRFVEDCKIVQQSWGSIVAQVNVHNGITAFAGSWHTSSLNARAF